MSKCNQSWLSCNQHRRVQHVYLTDFSSLLEPVFQSSHQTANARRLEKCVCCQGRMDPPQVRGGLAVQTCWFCRLFTYFQWLIPKESEGTSTAWILWHCQLLLSPHCHGIMSHSTCLSSMRAHHRFKLCYGLLVSTVCCAFVAGSDMIVHIGVSVHVTETAADTGFYGDLDPQLYLLGIYVRSDLNDRLGVREKKGIQ